MLFRSREVILILTAISKRVRDRNTVHTYPLEQSFHLLRRRWRFQIWRRDYPRVRRNAELCDHSLETARQVDVEEPRFLRIDSKTVNATRRKVRKRSSLGAYLIPA